MMVMEVVNARENHRMEVNDVETSKFKNKRLGWMDDSSMFHILE
jgi:hypothetical protein